MGPSSGSDILLFKHFRSTWPKLHHQPQDTSPLIVAPTYLLQFLRTTMDAKHSRKDYLEWIHLAAKMVGLPVVSSLRRPGALTRARWMAKALYALKILFRGNEEASHLTGRQLQGLQLFNRFVVLVYIQSWYSCRLAVDAAWSSDQSTLDGKSSLRVEDSLPGKRGSIASHWTTITRSSTIQPICCPSIHPVVVLVPHRCWCCIQRYHADSSITGIQRRGAESCRFADDG